jgi:hypothetical protein
LGNGVVQGTMPITKELEAHTHVTGPFTNMKGGRSCADGARISQGLQRETIWVL